MVVIEKVAGYEAFRKIVKELEGKALLNVYFTGEKNAQGVSWCPDCNVAEPVVVKALEEHADRDSHFIIVDVGSRLFWKDMRNPFRLDFDAPLTVIPTLISWQRRYRRLEGAQLENPALLEMFFSEDSD